MATDWVTISSLATAFGTLVLALATFSAVRSSNRSARVAERSLLAGLRPVLVPSRFEDPPTKVLFQDQRWVRLEGGHGSVEMDQAGIFLVVGVRNAGSGLAVLRGWRVCRTEMNVTEAPPLTSYRRQTRDIYISPGDASFWQGALRDPDDPDRALVHEIVTDREMLTVDLLYGDYEGGQRMISRFALVPVGESGWLASVSRHWNIDRDDPR
jgi:hypothetical protein